MTVQSMPEPIVKAKRNRSHRAFQIRDVTRFVTNPYEDAQSILTVALATKSSGQPGRVSIRVITTPQDYVGGIINRF